MRTTIIPAQITTVEDKIAGSLSMTQIVILMVPVIGSTIIYILLFPAMKLNGYKLMLIMTLTFISMVLALRFKEKLVVDWLGVLWRYHKRPQYYLYDKNDLLNRVVDLPPLPIKKTAKRQLIPKARQDKREINMGDLIKFEHLLASGKVALRYQFTKDQS